MFCRQCGTQIKGTEKFCPGCGVKLERKAASENGSVCSCCGAPLKPGVRFCKQCGTPVGAAPSEPEPLRCTCGEIRRPGAKFCKYCGAPADPAFPAVTIPVEENETVTSVIVSDEMPQSNSTAVMEQAGRRATAAVKQQAGNAVKKAAEEAIRKVISMDADASSTAGEMRIAMNSEQSGVLSVVVQSLLRR